MKAPSNSDSGTGDGTPAALRARNRERLLHELLRRIGTGATQAELAEAVGLSRPSIGSLLDTFDPITVKEQPKKPRDRSAPAVGRRGRLGTTYRIDRTAAWAAAIDIGRKHIYVGACDLTGAGDEIDKVEEPDPGFEISTSPQLTLERAAEKLNELLDAHPRYELADLCGLVVGLPGPVVNGHPRDRVLDWGELDVRAEIREALRSSGRRWLERQSEIDVIVDNDANLSAVAEHRWGAGVGKRDVFYIKWSTGLGAGLIVDGRLRRGARGAAGEFGHTPVPADQRGEVESCDVCRKPCFEAAIGFKRLLMDKGLDYRGVQAIACDPDHEDHRWLSEWIETRAELLGQALVPVANTLNPQLVIVDGILDQSMELLFARRILRSLEQHGAMAAVCSDLKIRGGQFTVSAAAKGGLALALDELAPAFLLQKTR